MIKIFIATGWSEGNWQRQRFAQAFTDDMELTANAGNADVIVGHSAGCYSLPVIKKAKLIVLINPPYRPERSLAKRIFQNVVLDTPVQIKDWGVKFWLSLRLHNWAYGIAHPLHHIEVNRSIHQTFQLAIAEADKIIVVRSTNDSFSDASLALYTKKFKGVKYIEVPGLHESCWHNPQPYIKLIQSEYERG